MIAKLHCGKEEKSAYSFIFKFHLFALGVYHLNNFKWKHIGSVKLRVSTKSGEIFVVA